MSITRFATCGWGALLLISAAITATAQSTLADAAEKEDSNAIRVLLEKKTDVNASQADGMTALHWATYHDDLPSVKLLIAAGADAKAANRYGVTPLNLACTNGNTDIVESLLEAGADPNSPLAGGETALMTASRTGRRGPVDALLSRGVDVNAREHKGQTALMWAAADGHVEVVDALLKAGADFRTPLPSGFTPLFFAVREGRADVLSRLIRAGADVNETMQPERKNGPTDAKATNPLILAVENGHFELAAALLKAGADPNNQPEGCTALHAITWVRKPIRGDTNPPPTGSGTLSSLGVVRQLVMYGADVNVRLENGESELGRFTTTGSTPFLLAARASDIPLMKLLVELGADPGVPNADKCTPLLAAAGVGALGDGDEAAGTEDEALEAVRVLLELGADVNAVDHNRETAMHGAAYQSRPRLVQFLAEQGADINVWNRKNKAGWTPLMIAQGHRPGNFRPAPDTIAALEHVMRAEGVEPPKATRDAGRRGDKGNGKRYVIIHADDAGMCHSVNRATIEAMEQGIVSSASIMVPCAWFKEFAAYAKAHPEKDFGIHLTLNSEWDHYRWGPTAGKDKVPSLVDKEGYLWDSVSEVVANAEADEVETELRAQVQRALDFGVPLTHLDTHMGAMVSRPDLVEVYINLAVEFNLPVFFLRNLEREVPDEAVRARALQLVEVLDEHELPVLDQMTQLYTNGSFEDKKAQYLEAIAKTKPGVHYLIVHCGYDDAELQAITSSNQLRDTDRRIFTDPDFIEAVKETGVEIVTWKQVRKMNKERAVAQ